MDGDDFIVLASDGLWEKVSDQECIDFIQEARNNGELVSTEICSDLVALACERGSTDDVTVMLIDLLEYRRQLVDVESRAISPHEIEGKQSSRIPSTDSVDDEMQCSREATPGARARDFTQPMTPRHNAGALNFFPDTAPTPRGNTTNETTFADPAPTPR